MLEVGVVVEGWAVDKTGDTLADCPIATGMLCAATRVGFLSNCILCCIGCCLRIGDLSIPFPFALLLLMFVVATGEEAVLGGDEGFGFFCA